MVLPGITHTVFQVIGGYSIVELAQANGRLMSVRDALPPEEDLLRSGLHLFSGLHGKPNNHAASTEEPPTLRRDVGTFISTHPQISTLLTAGLIACGGIAAIAGGAAAVALNGEGGVERYRRLKIWWKESRFI